MQAQGVHDAAQEQGWRQPLLVSGELEHPERRIVELQVRGRGHERDGDGRPQVRDERTAPLLWRTSRHAIDDQKDQRKHARCLDESAERQRDDRGKLPAANDECQRHRDRQRDEQVVVGARHRMEEDHRIRSERDDGERRPGWPHLERGPRDDEDGSHAREDRDHAVGVDLGDRRDERASDHAGKSAEQRAVDGGRIDPLRAEEMPQGVPRVRQRGLHVRVAAVRADDASVERVRVDVAREQQRQCEQDEVICRDEKQHGAKRDVPAPGLEQEEQERRDRQHGDQDAGRDEGVARQPVEEDGSPDPDERSSGNEPLRLHRLER